MIKPNNNDEGLNPCPFCGYANIFINGSDKAGGCWWVRCSNCASSSGNYKTIQEAKEAWNNRKEQRGKEQEYFKMCLFYRNNVDNFDGCLGLELGGDNDECGECRYRLKNLKKLLSKQESLCKKVIND